MSTRSIVKIKADENTIIFYRHWDGYIEEGGYQLACILNATKTYSKFVKALINQQRPIYEHDIGHPLYELVNSSNLGEEYTYLIEFKWDKKKGDLGEAQVSVLKNHYKTPDEYLFYRISPDKFMKHCGDKKHEQTKKEFAKLSA
jgi:hypothetical protein